MRGNVNFTMDEHGYVQVCPYISSPKYERMKNIYTILLTTAGLFYSLTGVAQTGKQKISTAYQTFENLASLKYGISAFTVLDAKTGAVVFEKNSNTGLATASTLKVITSATALDILGESYTFKTKLSYSGSIDSAGTLYGDLIIDGSGDPTLASDRFPAQNEENILNKWVYAIKNAGIKAIAGRIIGNDLHFNGTDIPGGWSWADMGNYYGAAVSGLNWRENKIGLDFAPAAVGQPASIRKISVNLAFITLINEVKTGSAGSGDKVSAYSAPYSNKIYLRGTHGKDLKKTIEISVPDPALDAAYALQKHLAAQQISTLHLPTTGKALQDSAIALPIYKTELNMHESPKLSEIVYWFNQKSINLYGEALLKTIGLISNNKSNSSDAAYMVSKYWEQKLKINLGELHLLDGSGLSAQNRVTTSAMCKIMHYAKSRPWYGSFYKSLPINNGIAMKSGTIGGVLAYTGYQESKSDQGYTFSLLVNNYQGNSRTMRQNMFTLLDVLK